MNAPLIAQCTLSLSLSVTHHASSCYSNLFVFLFVFVVVVVVVVVVVQVFHKIITSGMPRLQPLYDCLLTIMVNSESIE